MNVLRHARLSARSRGFTLVELLVALAIAVILLVLAAPTYVAWISDSQVNNAASTLAEGIRFAQAEAIKRNTNVEFTAAGGEWHVNVQGDSAKLRTAALAAGGANATLTPDPASSTTVTFNAFGQILLQNATTPTDPFTSVGVSATSGRPLRVLVTNGAGGTGIKVCDPDLSLANDPKGCP